MELLHTVIGPDEGASAAQLAVRAVVLFAFGIVCIRVAGRRTFAQYSPLDIIVALIVGSNISRIMTGSVPVLPALAATSVLVVLHRLLAVASLHWEFLPRLIKSRSIVVIRKGEVDGDAMARANLSRDDLYQAIRSEQAEHPADVELATMEPSGKLSVVHRKEAE